MNYNLYFSEEATDRGMLLDGPLALAQKNTDIKNKTSFMLDVLKDANFPFLFQSRGLSVSFC